MLEFQRFRTIVAEATSLRCSSFRKATRAVIPSKDIERPTAEQQKAFVDQFRTTAQQHHAELVAREAKGPPADATHSSSSGGGGMKRKEPASAEPRADVDDGEAKEEEDDRDREDRDQPAVVAARPKVKRQRSSRPAQQHRDAQIISLERKMLKMQEKELQLTQKIFQLKAESFEARMKGCIPLKKGAQVGNGTLFLLNHTSVIKPGVFYKLLQAPTSAVERGNDPWQAELEAVAVIRGTMCPYLPYFIGPAHVAFQSDGEEIRWHPAIAMENVPGLTLEQMNDAAAERTPMLLRDLSRAQKLKIAIQIVRAMQHLRKLNLVHRDLHPGNVLVTSEDIFKQILPPDHQYAGQPERALYAAGLHQAKFEMSATPSEDVRDFRVVVVDFNHSRRLVGADSESIDAARTWRGGLPDYQASSYWPAQPEGDADREGAPAEEKADSQPETEAVHFWREYDRHSLVLIVLGVLQGCLLSPTLEGENEEEKLSNEATARFRKWADSTPTASLASYFLNATLVPEHWCKGEPDHWSKSNTALRDWMKEHPDLRTALHEYSQYGRPKADALQRVHQHLEDALAGEISSQQPARQQPAAEEVAMRE